MRMTISKDWTPAERMKVATILLKMIQDDIYADRYSMIGRPNITSVQHILNCDSSELEPHREELEAMLEGIG